MNTESWEPLIQKLHASLHSDAAQKSLETHTYWPKWDSPWWHMLLLHEMGLAKTIPKRATDIMLEQTRSRSVPVFPVKGEIIPPGADPVLDTSCHCGLGNLYQMLRAAGAPVDEQLPWARAWFVKYQLPDGGYNCDEAAYADPEQASSMVATIAVAEALLSCGAARLNPAELAALDRCAGFMIARGLTRGSSTRFNAEEKLDEPDWLLPCFPRFYFYDVLRGLSFLLRWSEARERPLPRAPVFAVAEQLRAKFPDGRISTQRLCFEGVGTRLRAENGTWSRVPRALSFDLLERISRISQISPYLTAEWEQAQLLLEKLSKRGLFSELST